MTITYHYRPKELFFMDLNPDKLFLVWPELLAASTTPATMTTNPAVIPMQNQTTASTLTATSTVLDPSIMAMSVSDPENQTSAKPNFASVQGNTGQLNYSYPITVAPGPKGTAPSLALTYSSAESNGRSSPRSPAENVGEGWALTLGSITEEKEAGGSVWYFINGVDNVSDRLIPDSTTIQAGTNFATEHLSYLKVKMVNASFDSQQCFQVWDTAGNYYQFGCTRDSLQYYTDSGNNRTNYRYDLNQMLPASEGASSATRVLNASYLADGETNVGGHYSITMRCSNRSPMARAPQPIWPTTKPPKTVRGTDIVNKKPGEVYTERWYFTMDDGEGSKVVLSLNLNPNAGPAQDAWDTQHIHFSSRQLDPEKWGEQGSMRTGWGLDPCASDNPGDESGETFFSKIFSDVGPAVEDSTITEDLTERPYPFTLLHARTFLGFQLCQK